MNILTLDTCSDVMYITLAQDGHCRVRNAHQNIETLSSKKVANTAQSYNSAFLASTIAGILRENSLKMQDIEVIGANIGPGSFTGLRAGITTARVIAQQLDIPAVGIPSFQVYSHLNDTTGTRGCNPLPSSGTREHAPLPQQNTFCIMDARRGMAYCGIYNKNSEPILEPCLMDYENALAKAQNNDYFIISDNRMVPKLEEKGLQAVRFQESGADFGVFLVKEVVKALQTAPEGALTWAKLKPLYIQTPSITMPKK